MEATLRGLSPLTLVGPRATGKTTTAGRHAATIVNGENVIGSPALVALWNLWRQSGRCRLRVCIEDRGRFVQGDRVARLEATSRWSAIRSIAEKSSMSAETLRKRGPAVGA